MNRRGFFTRLFAGTVAVISARSLAHLTAEKSLTRYPLDATAYGGPAYSFADYIMYIPPSCMTVMLETREPLLIGQNVSVTIDGRVGACSGRGIGTVIGQSVDRTGTISRVMVELRPGELLRGEHTYQMLGETE